MIKLGVLGSSGRMGQWITKLVQTEYQSKFEITCEVDQENSDFTALLNTDAVIDFSLPSGTMAFVKATHGYPSQEIPLLISAVTGWTSEQNHELDSFSERAVVFQASNFSTGVLALEEILKKASPSLLKLGYQPILVESHHKHKKDAPSGTALTLRKAVSPDRPELIQTHAIRAGEVIGEHYLTFYGPADSIKIGHSAQDRSIFARGALEATLWLTKKKKDNPMLTGKFSMKQFFSEHILGEK